VQVLAKRLDAMNRSAPIGTELHFSVHLTYLGRGCMTTRMGVCDYQKGGVALPLALIVWSALIWPL
jgi:hypothetical protein